MINTTGTISLKRGREASVKRLHPWVFSGAIQSTEGTPQDGDWVEVKDAQKSTLGFGHFQILFRPKKYTTTKSLTHLTRGYLLK